MPIIKFEDFKKLDLRVAKILKVEDHPNADKLYILTVSTGDSEKNIVAGIKPYYKPEELFGKTIIIIDNLEAANIRGIESHGMLLAAKDDKTLAVLAPEKEISPGGRVS